MPFRSCMAGFSTNVHQCMLITSCVMCHQDDVLDLADLQRVHMLYLSQAQQECLMSAETKEVRAIVEPALQCIVDFAEHVRYGKKSAQHLVHIIVT